MSFEPLQPASNLRLSGERVAFTGTLSSITRRDARQLVVRLGGTPVARVTPRTTLLVIGEPSRKRRRASLSIRRAGRMASPDTGDLQIVTEEEFCKLVGLPGPCALGRRYYRARDILAMYPALRGRHLRQLDRRRIVRPIARTRADTYFSFRDLSTFRQVASELRRGAAFRAISRALVSAVDGQRAFDWLNQAGASVILLPAGAPPAATGGAAERHFLAAAVLDDADPQNRARAADEYRQALEEDPCLVAAMINLANIRAAEGAITHAIALYERALSIAPGLFEAHFNLGNIHHDAGQFDAAADCYRQALNSRPGHAEAHFFLAVSLERLNRPREAKPHWRAYLDLEPDGEHSDLAKQFDE